MLTERRGLGMASLLLALALLLSACGGGGGTTAPAGGTTPPAGGSTAPAGGSTAPVSGTVPVSGTNPVSGTVPLTGTSGTGTGGTPATGEPIKIGAIFDLTGPTADVSTPYSKGQIAFVKWKNANGGVGGRPIELLSQDYAYDVTKAEELYTQYIGEKVVAFSGWGTGDTEALRSKIAQDKIPFISGSYSAALANPTDAPYNFLTAPTYSDQLIIAMKWALADWKSKGNAGAPKFAYLINDSPFGRSPLAEGTAFAKANGVADPLEVPSPKGATDITGQLTQIKDSGANYVFIQNTSAPAKLALGGAKGLGLKAQFVCLNWCANELLIKLAGADAEGVVGTIPFSPSGPGAELALSYAKANGIDFGGADSSFVQGWTALSILVAGMEKTVKDGKPLTGENIKASLETLANFDTGGVTQPITFTATDHAGSKALRVFQVKGGKWEPLTEFMTAK